MDPTTLTMLITALEMLAALTLVAMIPAFWRKLVLRRTTAPDSREEERKPHPRFALLCVFVFAGISFKALASNVVAVPLETLLISPLCYLALVLTLAYQGNLLPNYLLETQKAPQTRA